MKRTMKFLTRLYPSSWRKRYGVELAALLEDATPTTRDAFDIFWGALKMQMTTWTFWRIILTGSTAGILVAAVVSFYAPVQYSSQALFTATPADECTRRVLSDVERNVLSRESLASVIKEHNLYSRERASMSPDDVIDTMSRHIRVHLMPIDSAGNRDSLNFVVQFDYSDPDVARQVNEELAGRFMEGNFEVARQFDSRTTLRLPEPPSLPLSPASPNRTQFVAVGLFAGLIVGLTLAIVVRWRRNTTVGTA
jgi:capsular polysaccharide biosynthesis protein